MLDEKTGYRIAKLKRNDVKLKTFIEMLDLTLKISTLLFFILCGLGFIAIFNYMSSNGLMRESFLFTTSFNYLFSIALFFVFISISFSMFFVFVPFVINDINKSSIYKWSNVTEKKIKLYDTLIYLWLFFAVFLAIIVFEITGGNYYYALTILLIYFIVTVFLYTKIRSDNNEFSRNFIGVLVTSSFLFVLNAIFIISIFPVINSIYPSFYAFLVFYFIFLFINFILSMSFNNRKLLLRLYLLLVLVLVSFFTYDSKLLLGKIGIGGYVSSFLVKYQDIDGYYSLFSNVEVIDSSCDTISKKNIKEYECHIGNDVFYKKDPKVILLKNVFVVAVLPDKLIISSTKKDKKMYSISKSNIISEVIDKN